MLFNSYEFILLFLPVTLAGFFLFARLGHVPAIVWLVLASLFFYGWWNPAYLLLLATSVLANFWIAQQLGQMRQARRRRYAQFWLALGVTFNLGLLGWFKYANFAVATLNDITGATLYLQAIVLPLAISFFTFQQIAYLVDVHRGLAYEHRFLNYVLFVTFFPQLIAGPIVHHSDMLPQFEARETLRPHITNIAIGLTIFAIGLFKKVVLADGIAPYAYPVFDAAARGDALTLLQAWGGALAYTFQLYFDFSGYTDMAIGAARLFGIRLPLNFHSPYKATSIVEFWRRWHMTLSRFLRDYLYIPLGGNRRGPIMRYRNLLLTMILGGLWHGAGWTFIVWGALHGGYLAICHTWGRLYRSLGWGALLPQPITRLLGWLLTFIAVVVGWVFFRASDLTAALHLLEAMAGMQGVALPNAIAVRLGEIWPVLAGWGVETYLGGGEAFMMTWLWLVALFAAAVLLPNTQQVMRFAAPALHDFTGGTRNEVRFLPRLPESWCWRPTAGWALAAGFLMATGLLGLTSVSEFLYFQF